MGISRVADREVDLSPTTAAGVSGFTEVVVSVTDIDRACRPFIELAGWRREDLHEAPAAQREQWGLTDPDCRIEQALLWPDLDTRTRLRLVRFLNVDQVLMRSAQHTWDTGGIFDIDVYVRDCAQTFRGLQRAGWSGYGDPTRYQWGGFDVTEALATGPDGFVVGLLQAHGKVLVELPPFRAVSRAFNSAQVVRDFAAPRGADPRPRRRSLQRAHRARTGAVRAGGLLRHPLARRGAAGVLLRTVRRPAT
jgi:hypothetical protein